jgi:transcriptional regulator with XRE-family HTH domain
VSDIQKALTQIQLRLQVSVGRRLTYRELAELAGTSERTMAEWMRGATSPMAMTALLSLMAHLNTNDATDVLSEWRRAALSDKSSSTLDPH